MKISSLVINEKNEMFIDEKKKKKNYETTRLKEK